MTSRRPNIYHVWVSVVVLLWLCIGRNLPAYTASVLPTETENCPLRLSGAIEIGDFERFRAQAKLHFPGSDGESTHRDVVCLDSPGGNFSEGVKFGDYFYSEGVGTFLEDQAECYSACAIMFMMGTAQGPEVAFANRRMMLRSTLGFHRPYLRPRIEGAVGLSAAEIAMLYDSALQSALNLVAMGNRKAPWSNEPMMKSALVEKMLLHTGNDFFLIDTVEKTQVFNIEIVGMPRVGRLTEEQAFYACENALQWQIGLTEDEINFDKASAGENGYERVRRLPTVDGLNAFEVDGLSNGYGVEHCIIVETPGGIEGCGVDEYTGVQISSACNKENYRQKMIALPPHVRFHPWTKLAAISETARSTPVEIPLGTRCFVIRGGDKIDDDPCLMTSRSITSGKWVNASLTEFVWPSGAKTVLIRDAMRTEINGAETWARGDSRYGTCFPNSASGNDFCFQTAPL